MSSNAQLKSAALELMARRTSANKFQRLNEDIRPTSLDQALEIQSQMSVLSEHEIAGWKCLLPPDEDKVVVAPIYKNTVFSGREAKLYRDNDVARIEPEIVFILSKNLPAQNDGYTEKEIDDAIGSTHMALELIQARYSESQAPAFPELLADGLCNQGLFIGPEINKSDVYTASDINIAFNQGGESKEIKGSHPNKYPQLPIYWLINYMTNKGISFKSGDAIITGSYAGVVDLNFGSVEIEYQGLGKYNVDLVELK